MKHINDLINERFNRFDMPLSEFTRVDIKECAHNLKLFITDIITETHKDKQQKHHELCKKLLDIIKEYE